jgi:hypothetical protein
VSTIGSASTVIHDCRCRPFFILEDDTPLYLLHNVKVKLHGTSKESWLRIAEDRGLPCEQRPCKTEYIGVITFPEKGFDRALRQVIQVIVQTIDRDGLHTYILNLLKIPLAL